MRKIQTFRVSLIVVVLLACVVIGIMLTSSSAEAQSEIAGSAMQTGELITAGIYQGISPVVRFDVSPPLSQLAAQVGPQPAVRGEVLERDTGLEGPLGPQDVDPLVQSTTGPSLIPPPLVSFDGPANIAGVSPPDPVGDVGPNHYVAMSNLYTAVYLKDGTLVLGPLPNNSFWTGFGGDCQTDNAGDPIVLYDQFADRWLVTQFTSSGPTFFNCVAISTSPDPTSTYYRYAISTGTNFPDYPKYGVWPDAYYISTREFGGASFAGVGAYAIDRSEMIVGDPNPTVIAFLVPPGGTPYNVGDGLLPSDLDGSTLPPAGSPNYFMGSMDDGGQYGAPLDALTVWEFAVDFVTPANSTFTLEDTIPVAPFDSQFPCSPSSRSCIPQPGTSNKVDILSYRQRPMHRLAYRNFGTHESLVTNQSVEAAPNMAGVRWYEIRDPGGTPTVYQQGTYAPGVSDSIHRWMGSVAMDNSGNMALGYSASDATSTFPSVWYTGRLVNDPLGTLPQGEGSIIDGTGSQTGSGRWGDYTSMNIDPVDDCTFWYVNEYLPTTSSVGWQLRIGAFRFDQCGAPDFTISADPTTVNACIPDDAVYTVDIGSIDGFSDPVTLSTQGEPVGYTPGFSVNPVNPPGSSILTLSGSGGASAGSYNVDIVGVAPTSTHTTTVGLNLYDAAATVNLVSPADGASDVQLAPTFTWTGTGISYTIEIATDAGFTNIVESATVEDTDYTSGGLASNTTHYWRVTANNVCGSNVSPTWSFTTVDLQCSTPNLAIPDNTPSGVTDDLLIGSGGSIDDLNVSIEVSHTWVGDLMFELEHVDTGTSVVFYDRPGVPASTFGCSGDDIDATLDDEAATPVENECGAGTPSIQGTFIPNNALSAFDGEDLSGTWRITASDHAGGDTGTLTTWCVDAATTGGGGDPDIVVEPDSLASAQDPDVQVTLPMTISNVGTADLNWTIEETDTSPAVAPDVGGNPERQGGAAASSPQTAAPLANRPGGEVVQDGGFEAGTPNPFWNEFSSNFGTPLCDIPSCGQGGGTGPHGGAWWAWFGGISGVSESGSVDQDVTIPVGTATLSYWLEIPVADTTGTLDVSIDGNVIASYTEADTGAFIVYQQESFDVSAYADGGVHNLEFSSTTNAGAGPLNFFIDDVSLIVDAPTTGCDAPVDVPWLSVNPAAGTTISGTSTTVDVTFDSTGLAPAVYTGTLCVNSNDPDEPLVTVPVTLTVDEEVVEASIELTKTVGIDNTTCATESTLVVGQPTTEVYYCYTVANTGDITMSVHDLVDDKLGTILSGFAYDLAPGDMVSVYPVTATISGTVVNVATWTARDAAGGNEVTATATATVTEMPTDVSLVGFGADSTAALLPAMLTLLLAVMLAGAMVRRRKTS